MFTIYYNKKITKLQLELYNFLSKEHNPLVEFIISFLYCILEKSIINSTNGLCSLDKKL